MVHKKYKDYINSYLGLTDPVDCSGSSSANRLVLEHLKTCLFCFSWTKSIFLYDFSEWKSQIDSKPWISIKYPNLDILASKTRIWLGNTPKSHRKLVLGFTLLENTKANCFGQQYKFWGRFSARKDSFIEILIFSIFNFIFGSFRSVFRWMGI